MVKSEPRIYAITIDGNSFKSGEEKHILHFYYLDLEAEYINGYDICEGNLAAHSLCLNEAVFNATLVFVDGKEKPCTVVSFLDEQTRRMRGYVWLSSDKDAQPFIADYIKKYREIYHG